MVVTSKMAQKAQYFVLEQNTQYFWNQHLKRSKKQALDLSKYSAGW